MAGTVGFGSSRGCSEAAFPVEGSGPGVAAERCGVQRSGACPSAAAAATSSARNGVDPGNVANATRTRLTRRRKPFAAFMDTSPRAPGAFGRRSGFCNRNRYRHLRDRNFRENRRDRQGCSRAPGLPRWRRARRKIRALGKWGGWWRRRNPAQASSARPRSAIRSAVSSMPSASRIMLSPIPNDSRSAGE